MEEIRIKELGEIYTGKTPPTANPKNFGTDYPFVTPVDLTANKYIKETERSVSKTGIKHTTLIPSNSICVSCIGYIGKIGITICGSCTNQQINSIVVNKHFDIDYVYYLLNYNVPYFKELAGVNVVAQLNKSDFSKVKLKTTKSKPEQTAIATILSKVDETIEATKNSIKAAEKLKKSLMQNLLTGKLKPDGTWRTEDEFYEDEKFGKVPVGWEVARVKDYGFVQTGKTPPTSEPKVFSETENEKRYPFVTPGDLGNSKYISKSERYVTEKGIGYSFKVPKNSVFVVCIGSTIGKIGIAKNESCTNQQINTLIANDDNSSEFFYYMMVYRKPHFKEIAGINATPQINKSGFNKYKLLRPIEKDEQIQIAIKLKAMDEKVDSKNKKIKKLQRLKKSLMQNLLTGKIRLPKEFIAQFENELEVSKTTTA